MGTVMPAPLIEGVSLTPLKVISAQGGPVLHMLRCDSPLFSGFGEVYFSEVEQGAVKAWKRHREMTQNFAVPSGAVRFVIFDDRKGSSTCGTLGVYELGRPDSYFLLTLPPLLWYGFTGLSSGLNLIANCTNIPHKPEESERVEPEDADFIPYQWL